MKNIYQIDAAHSNVQFSVRHLMVSNVRGTFTGVKGTVSYDPADPSNTAIDAEIDVNSVNTNDEKRDGHLKSPDFFDAGQYPVMKFKSKRIDATSATEQKITGDLTLHGVTKELTLVVDEVSEEAKDPWGNTRIGATAKGKLKRSDFGLSWNAALETGGVMVGDDVKLEFDLELSRRRQRPRSSSWEMFLSAPSPITSWGTQKNLMKKIFLFAALATGLILPLAVSAQDHDRDRDHDRDHRYYDRHHRDYHEWNPREDRAWHMYWEERHRPYIDWDRARERDRQRYWEWRHRHSDSLLHIEIR